MSRPASVGNDEVLTLLAHGAQLVEVLPEREYQEEHLPGAINLPLHEVAARAEACLDRGRPVVVYCYDTECDLSPRAAVTLVAMGFPQVYDLATGKMGWLAAGLPTQRTGEHEARLGELAVTDVVRLAPEVEWSLARDWVPEGEIACVVNEHDVLLGVVPQNQPRLDGERVSDVMHPAPSTFRPHIGAREMADYLSRHPLRTVVVTRSNGTVVGVVDPAAVRRAAGIEGRSPSPRVWQRIRRQQIEAR